jgi:hypothetical protein
MKTLEITFLGVQKTAENCNKLQQNAEESTREAGVGEMRPARALRGRGVFPFPSAERKGNASGRETGEAKGRGAGIKSEGTWKLLSERELSSHVRGRVEVKAIADLPQKQKSGVRCAARIGINLRTIIAWIIYFVNIKNLPEIVCRSRRGEAGSYSRHQRKHSSASNTARSMLLARSWN